MYVLALQVFNMTVSNTAAWIVSVAFAYVTNKFYVFRQEELSAKRTMKELLLFFGARALSGLIEIAGLPFLVFLGLNQTIFGIEGALAKGMITVFIVVLNYIFSKYLIFKKQG